ncbi:MAG: S-methyl-5-thioribose-1-phosphate isomerase [Clostridia bacterium]|nr:S-methyl-5-thioribose-1-phosphate isomerase [Clostridia bacterium]
MRKDTGLAPMLQYENIAWFENGKVRILDRRIFPAKKEFVYCEDYHEVAKAIKDMVTQSAGPFTAAPMGMALAAFQCKNETEEKQREILNDAADVISSARPTTQKRMRFLVDECLKTADLALKEGKNVSEAIVNKTIELNDERYSAIDNIAKHLTQKFPNGGHIMTYCWAETIVGMMLKNCKEQNKDIKLYCCETRPYFQGARLTAFELQSAGVDVTLICDNMSATVMKQGKINAVFVGCDRVAANGDTANKIGTSVVAAVAKYYNVPVYICAPTSTIDLDTPTGAEINIEQRPEKEVTEMWYSERMAPADVKVFNPAFDVTDHELIAGIITENGIAYEPYTESLKEMVLQAGGRR